MGFFDGPYTQRRMAYEPVGIDSNAALQLCLRELLGAAQDCGLRASSRPMNPGQFKVDVTSLDSVGGFIHDSGDVIWFFKGPQKKVALLMDRFLTRTNAQKSLLCTLLPSDH
jgi:hypothetical protein